MSLDTWKAEFYPIPASACPPGQAVEHSLRKWRGLRKENLERHGIERDGRFIGIEFRIGDETCALCRIYYDHKAAYRDACNDCPIHQLTGARCDSSGSPYDSFGSPYDSFVTNGDPEPMIALLERTLAWERNQEHKEKADEATDSDTTAS